MAAKGKLGEYLGGKDARHLDSQVAMNIVWAKRLHSRSYEVWFANESKFDDAKRKQKVDEKSQTGQPNSRKAKIRR